MRNEAICLPFFYIFCWLLLKAGPPGFTPSARVVINHRDYRDYGGTVSTSSVTSPPWWSFFFLARGFPGFLRGLHILSHWHYSSITFPMWIFFSVEPSGLVLYNSCFYLILRYISRWNLLPPFGLNIFPASISGVILKLRSNFGQGVFFNFQWGIKYKKTGSIKKQVCRIIP